MILKRILAFCVDYLIIAVYILILASFTIYFSNLFNLDLQVNNVLIEQLIGFCTLILPVILYFTLSENSHYTATIGKKVLGLKVVDNSSQVASFYQLLTRNCIKFLPWIIAHYFIYQLFYFTRNLIEVPSWVLFGLIFSIILDVIYLFLMVFNKQNRSLYEIISNTKVIIKSKN